MSQDRVPSGGPSDHRSSPVSIRPSSPSQVPQIPPHNGGAASPVFGSPRLTPQAGPARSLNASPSLRPANIEPLPSNAAGAVSPAGRPALPTPLVFQMADSVYADELTDAQKAEIVRRHLLSADEAQKVAAESAIEAGGTATSSSAAAAAPEAQEGANAGDDAIDDSEFPTPYNTQGGDIVAPIYKWAQSQPGPSSGQRTPSLRRSKSMASFDNNNARRLSSSMHDIESGPAVRDLMEPGGFRRDFVRRSQPEASQRFTRSFVDFLSLYGHFGGEDLEEIEEEDEEDTAYDESTIRGVPSGEDLRKGNERTPLLRQSSTRPRVSRAQSSRRRNSDGSKGDATVTQAVLMLLKSFVGTGVLFLGKAFMNGGILFSTITLCAIAMISLYSFLLLVETRLIIHGSFGDIGGELYGKYMRWSILTSIVLSQIGFVSAYTIFVSENLQAFFMAVTNCRTYIALPLLILAQLVIFMPLAMIRNIQKLSGTALVADAFILFGLIYIFSNEIKVLADNGLADVKLFNPRDFPLLIGTAVFSFEGIGLVIPITESMKEPRKFPAVLSGVMIGVMVLFAGGGALAYAAYGSAIQTVVFVNLPQDDKFVNAAQFLYSIAILLSTPLQLFPAVRIMENGLFSRSGKYSSKVKWEKNMFRMAVVVGCAVISWAGASDLDKFVSLIGSVACVPLGFCYPAMLHYKACARTRKQKVIDIVLFIFGVLAALFTTTNTILALATGGPTAPPKFGKCPPRA